MRDRWRDRGMDRKREMDGKNEEGIEGATGRDRTRIKVINRWRDEKS